MDIHGPTPGDAATCEHILRSLPSWFGLEDPLVQYIKSIQQMPTFTAVLNGACVGFTSIEQHFPLAAEIHVMGVLPDHHRSGAGRAMVEAAEVWLRGQGCRFLQVKTLSASRDDPAYAKTRRFYEAIGFVPLQEFPTLWDAANPCLQMIKDL